MRLPPVARIALGALLPIVAVAELALAEVQRRRVPTDDHWRAAAAAAKQAKQPGDMVLVAPRWAEPLGRKAIGEVDPSLIDLAMVGRSDLDTVPRVLELSIRGKDDPQTKGWSLIDEKTFGHVKLRTLKNPKPEKLVRDLVDEFGPEVQAMKVAANGTTEACRWETTPSRMPNLFQGPGFPPQHFLCAPYEPSWTWVGVTVITDLEYKPRRCILMHPSDQATAVVWPSKPIGKRVVAYVGLHVFVEREMNKAPFHVGVFIAGKQVATARHKDGDGWLRFEGSTGELAGQSHPVEIRTWAEGSPQFRVACVAAQLRD